MPRRLLLLFLLAAGFGAAAQQQTVRGSVSDTIAHKPLHRAVIKLISTKDSVLNTFTRAAEDGAFVLHPDTAGQFLLIVSYPAYAEFRDVIVVKAAQPLELGNIILITRTHVLEEFVLRKKQSAIRINGDTTEFAADSFAVAEGATVETLLKKLPGITIDRNGAITAQGEKVQKLLVDGEEFFSDDPAVVTQSLQARTIETVQVYDKKSDAAIMTGIDDGQRMKTINLKLKENMKKGAFGKLALAGGMDGYYENQLMVNAFKGKRQLSAFGIMSNTGVVGLGWGDRGKYGGSGGMTFFSEDGSRTSVFSSSSDDLFGGGEGQYTGEGLPTVWTGGLHYANKWDEGKEHLSGNYRFARQNVEATGNTFTQYILPDSQYFSNQRRSSFSTGDRHGADALFDLVIDTNTTLQVTLNADHVHNVKTSDFFTETIGGDGGMINDSRRRIGNDAVTKSQAGSLLYRKRFAKKGRSAFFQLQENFRNTDGAGTLVSENHYYTAALPDDTVNQRKTAQSDVLTLTGDASFTEPLSKTLLLNAGYGLSLINSSSELLSFNRLGNEFSDAADTLYSSSYRYNVATHRGKTSLNFKMKKYNITVGASVFHTSFHQEDLLRDTSFSRAYNNFSPMASANWEVRKQTNLSFYYEGSTRQPTLEQIQPLRQNTDPLNIAIGNPALKQAFTNSINLRYSRSKTLSGQYIYSGISFSFVQDAISQTQYTDEIGRRTYQYINVDGNYNGSCNFGGSRRFSSRDFRIGASGRVSRNHYNNYINGTLNTTDNETYTASLDFNKSWKKGDKQIADVTCSPSLTYNHNDATISSLISSYRSAGISGYAHVELPWKLSITSDVQASFRQRTVTLNRNNDVVAWNASIGRKMLKGDVLEIKIMAFDILNQNIGFSRYSQGNYITENNYNTIRRRIMLNVTWNFSYTPESPVKGEGK